MGDEHEGRSGAVGRRRGLPALAVQPHPGLRATSSASTATELLELVFGPYHEDTDHPWHRLERGELTFDECNTALIATAAEAGHEVDPMAVLMRMGGDGMQIVREDVVAAAHRGQGRRPDSTAIITNNIAEFSDGWRGLFDDLDAMVDLDHRLLRRVGLRKPDPAIFHLTLERLGGIAPDAGRLPRRRPRQHRRR